MNKMTPMMTVLSVLLVLTLGSSNVRAGKKKKNAPPPIELTETGKALEAKYASMLTALKTELTTTLPKVPAEKQTDFLKALGGIRGFLTDKYTKTKALEACQATSSWRLGRAERRLASATEALLLAQENLKAVNIRPDSDPEKAGKLEQATADLKKATEDKEKAIAGLANAKEKADKALADEPGLVKELAAATEALLQANTDLAKAYKTLGVDALLAGTDMQEKLVKYIVLSEATPRGLAEFGQQGADKVALIDALLGDADVMQKMLVADGAKDGKYGSAMEILTAIRKAYPKSNEGVLGRLAIAISVELAVPRPLRNATGLKDAPASVDPVKRYQAYKTAYLNDELDPGFKDQDSYSLRMVVNGEEPDDIAAWGRKMLSNYRPDHITTADYRWRYVKAVKTDVRYGSQDQKYDKPELQFFQNIIMNGGICGRRAFFGRFILRAFGVPTTARPQPGHAALTHWTPDGWVVCLGAGWGRGGTHTKYSKDLDFLANVQARDNAVRFNKVKRAQWIGDVLGEKQVFGLHTGEPQLWYGISLYEQMAMNDEAKAKALAAVGTDIGEANESVVKEEVNKAGITDNDRKILVAANGTITIPAAACSMPTDNTAKITFMKSNLGGMQLHYARLGGKQESFEYTFEAPEAGKYALTARVVTPSWKQHLYVSANGAKEPVDMALPFTVGMWDTTAPVKLDLVKGKNVLTFSREHENLKGISIRDFTLTPVK